MEEYTNSLAENVTGLKVVSSLIHTHVLTLQTRYEQFNQQSTQHFEELAQTLTHYNTSTNAIKEEVGSALEQCAIDEKSTVDYVSYFNQINNLLEKLSRIPEEIQDWPAAQILLHTQLHQLTLNLLQAKPLREKDKQKLVERWGQAEALFSNWKKAFGTLSLIHI